MMLLGAREFIKCPAGTFYVSYWMDNQRECLEIIEKFRHNPNDFLNLEPDELHVFGNNSGSMLFTDEKEEDYIFYYDANVVGDASPETTLYLVIEESELPNIITIRNFDGEITELSKIDVIKTKNKFTETCDKSKDDWALSRLDELSNNEYSIVDTKIII